MTALSHRHGRRPGKPAHASLRSKSDGKRPTRERGRPARMHSRSVPLSFPGTRHPATLPAGTAWARPKQGPAAVAGRAGWRSWPRLCQNLCGRDARAPGWTSSPDVVAPKELHRYSCPFVFFRGSSSTTTGSFFLQSYARPPYRTVRSRALPPPHQPSLGWLRPHLGGATSPPTASAFAIRLGFCDSPSRGE